jgi:hypothetical protein
MEKHYPLTFSIAQALASNREPVRVGAVGRRFELGLRQASRRIRCSPISAMERKRTEQRMAEETIV